MSLVVGLRGAVVHHGGDVTVALRLARDICRAHEKAMSTYYSMFPTIEAMAVGLREAKVHHGGSATVVVQLALDTC
jgi:hypothetical protein